MKRAGFGILGENKKTPHFCGVLLLSINEHFLAMPSLHAHATLYPV